MAPLELPGVLAADDALLPLSEVERRHILSVLAHHGGSRRATARTLGIGTNTLWRKLNAYGVAGRPVRGRPGRRRTRATKVGS